MRKPLYNMTDQQELQYFSVCNALRRLGCVVMSEPLEGKQEQWLAGLLEKLDRIEARLKEVNKAYRTRGASKAALYYLTSPRLFDPGFGIDVSADQKKANEKCRRTLERGVAKWDAMYGSPD